MRGGIMNKGLPNNIDAEKEGKIVCFTGMISSDDTLSDKVFNISVDKCLTLKRKVEMYQYYEKNINTEKELVKNPIELIIHTLTTKIGLNI